MYLLTFEICINVLYSNFLNAFILMQCFFGSVFCLCEFVLCKIHGFGGCVISKLFSHAFSRLPLWSTVFYASFFHPFLLHCCICILCFSFPLSLSLVSPTAVCTRKTIFAGDFTVELWFKWTKKSMWVEQVS